MNEKIISLIPARSGSEGINNKNIFPLLEYPLIAYSIIASKMSNKIKRTIVSTDSEIYYNIALEYGAEVPFLRPIEYSGDKSTDYDFVKHLLDWINLSRNQKTLMLSSFHPFTLERTNYILMIISLMTLFLINCGNKQKYCQKKV